MHPHHSAAEWQAFRLFMFEHDGGVCCHCGSSLQERVFQVHHKRYVTGKEPWKYPPSDCETLCQACHAAVHGRVPPRMGWRYVADEDLEELAGTCENCGADLRYVFYIEHPDWGVMEVGTVCCDNLTGTTIASELRRYEIRKQRFVTSARWQNNTISQFGITVAIVREQNGYYVCLDDRHGRIAHATLDQAKAAAFDVIEKQNIKEWLAAHPA